MLRLDMQSRLDEERPAIERGHESASGQNSHQPSLGREIYEDKVSPGTEHACYLAYACCLVLPVVERGSAQYQVNRGVL